VVLVLPVDVTKVVPESVKISAVLRYTAYEVALVHVFQVSVMEPLELVLGEISASVGDGGGDTVTTTLCQADMGPIPAALAAATA